MNTIGGDIIDLLFASLDEVNKNFQGLVIGNEGQNFSAGANLMLLLMEAVEGNWDEIDLMVRTFQRATQAIRYNAKPAVTAPFSLTLGGGCEIMEATALAIASARRQERYRPVAHDDGVGAGARTRWQGLIAGAIRGASAGRTRTYPA